MVTEAKPKIADYHFTTLEPNLGVVKTEYGDSFVIADIPGIIEGASQGVGLGLQFLRHIERTRLLLHVIDVSGTEGRDPVEDFKTINNELKKYSEKLASRKQIIVANKADVMQDEMLYENLNKMAQKLNMKIYKVSAATGQGLKELFKDVAEELKTLPKEDIIGTEEKIVYTLKEERKGFDINKEKGEYYVTGPDVDRLMARVNLSDNESMYYFQKMLVNLGIDEALKKAGAQDRRYNTF